MQTQSSESVKQTRQSQQRINPHIQGQHQTKLTRKQQSPASNTQEENDIKEKLKAMLTQVHRGESAPRVTGQYPQGLKTNQNAQAHQGRNNRYTSNSVNTTNRQGYGGQQNYQGQHGRQRGNEFVFGRSQRPYGLLGPQPEHLRGRKTLVLDLDETLVHSQFNQVRNPDYTIPVDIEGRTSNIYVMKRPGAEYFLQQMAQYFEVVIYTASLSKYADPLMNKMDPQGYCTDRLFREHCTFVNGVFVKDMAQLGRNMKDAIIIDNSPTSYMLQPECGMPIVSWYDDPQDRALFDYIPMLIEMSKIHDMREAITGFVRNNTFSISSSLSVIGQIREREQLDQQRRMEQDRMRKQLQLQQEEQLREQLKLEQQKQAVTSNVVSGADENPQSRESKQQQPQQQQASSPAAVTPKAAENQKQPSQQQVKKKPLINSWFVKQTTGQGLREEHRGGSRDRGDEARSNNQHIQLAKQKQSQQQQQRQRSLNQQQQPQQQRGAAEEGKEQQTLAISGPSPQLLINTTNDPLQVQQPPQRRESNKNNKSGEQPGPQGRLANGTSTSQQKVTNITNIIYNFNYGTPQAQTQGSMSPQANGSTEAATSLDAAGQKQQQSRPQGGRKIKVDPNLQINVNSAAGQPGNDKDPKRATPLKPGQQQEASVGEEGEEGTNLATGHKKRPNTGSGSGANNQQFRQSFKRNTQGSASPGSAAVLKPKDNGIAEQNNTQPDQNHMKNGPGLNQQYGQSENQIGKVVKMSRKSTIDQKDASLGKMMVVLEKNRAGSQKKAEFAQSFSGGGGTANHDIAKQVSPTTQIQNKMLQVHVNGAKSLKSKLKQNVPFISGHTPKVLPIEIGNQRQLFNQIKTPQSALMGNMSIQKSFAKGGENRTIKAFTPSGAAGPELRYQNNSSEQNTLQGIFNFNQSPTAASQNSQSVMLTTPQNGSLKNSHAHQKQAATAVGPINAVTTETRGGKRQVQQQQQQQQQQSNKVRSFSQNQGSRKGNINSILVYNQQGVAQMQNAGHGRNQSTALPSAQQQQASHHTQHQYSLQLQPHSVHQGSIQIGTRSVQNANGQSQILYTESPQLDASMPQALRNEKQNHSALVEKYSNFLVNSKAGTPSGGDISLQRAQHQQQAQQRLSQNQIISKLRNSQNQALPSHKQGSGSSGPGYPNRNLLVIPQNAVNQASNNNHGYMAISPKAQMAGGSRGGSRDKFVQSKTGAGNYSQTQVNRNQRVFIINNGNNDGNNSATVGKQSDSSLKGGSADMGAHKMQNHDLNTGSAQQPNFQMQVKPPTTHGKSSPKQQQAIGYSFKKQNPFKGPAAAPNVGPDVQGAAMQQHHAQFVNQPHHLMMPNHGLTNIMASSQAMDMEDAINLQNLYPQSQSPMSFKQMQKAKRQKRVNASNMITNTNANAPGAAGTHAQSRTSGNGSHLNAAQSPLQQFYTVSKIQNSRH